jgi:hypothetical protein
MHLDSHKIFEAYVLAKRVENQQLNEGIFDDIKGYWKERGERKEKKEMGKRKSEIIEMYKKLWLGYWYPRFSDEKEVEINKPKAIRIFKEFIQNEDWGEYEKNAKKAIEYFEKNHGRLPYKELENDAIETLIYGETSRRVPLPSKKEKKPDDVDETPEDISVAHDKKEETVSASEYKTDAATKEKVDASHARPSTVAPTPEPVASSSKTKEEPSEDVYKLKAEITRMKNLNQAWVNAIKKKFGRTVRKPSDLSGKPAVKKSVGGKK